LKPLILKVPVLLVVVNLFVFVHPSLKGVIVGAMVIVWRVRGKIIRSVLCNIVCTSCAQCNAHTWTDL